MGRIFRLWVIVAAAGLIAGCESMAPEPMDDGPIAEGIAAKLGEPVPSATAEQLATFDRGQVVMNRRFSLEDGLGPAFNVVSCGACHERPASGGGSALYRNFQLTGRLTEDGAFLPGTSAGMSGGVLRVFRYDEDRLFRPAVPEESTIFTQRNAIPMFGVGLIAELAEEDILVNEDADDADGDGISGRPNFDRGFVGRFGRKSQTVSIEGFIRGPLFNHLGVTTVPLDDEQRAQLPVDSSGGVVAPKTARILQAAAPDAPNFDTDGAPDPEMSSQDLFDLVSFTMLLAAPKFDEPTEQSNRGRLLFHEARCSGCHVPRLDGPRGPLPVYSDFLLHDMGDDLADGIQQGVALPGEFRTQPLWGLVAVGPYLHDGRATTIEDAILAHGGEAQSARDAYADFSRAEKDDVREFLLSLGGRDQASTGLLPPNAEVPAVGEFGGPMRELTTAEMERFIRGREIFDRDFGADAGVGGLTGGEDDPRFNGDSCRACHFDPVIGGSGPRDVNVMRCAVIDENGDSLTPPNTVNTILHKHHVMALGPVEPDATVNVFEHRQTPPLFGSGLLDAVSEETILLLADPDDENGDGISGRPNVLPGDGRIGRFGWKADVPSAAEFMRDGFAAEIGITVGAQEGLTFGITEDVDDVPDPELFPDDAEDATFFMTMLAPPPRQQYTGAQAEQVQAGEQVFAAVGCVKCHVPSLPTTLGVPAPMYSDLLLHEILPEGQAGIVSGDAQQREFRTAPLWGLSQSAPYFHSGEADTIDQAVRLHDGEAAGIRTAYENLSTEDRDALLAFLNSL